MVRALRPANTPPDWELPTDPEMVPLQGAPTRSGNMEIPIAKKKKKPTVVKELRDGKQESCPLSFLPLPESVVILIISRKPAHTLRTTPFHPEQWVTLHNIYASMQFLITLQEGRSERSDHMW